MEAEWEAMFLTLRRNALMEEIGVFTGRWRDEYARFSRPFTTPLGRAYWEYWYDDSVDWMREMQVYIDNADPALESDYMNMLRESVNSGRE